jgi:hypothetical protein
MSDFTQDELEASFDEMFDEIYPVVKFGELTFYPSRILKELDPIAYGIAVSEHEHYLAEQEQDVVCDECGAVHDEPENTELTIKEGN